MTKTWTPEMDATLLDSLERNVRYLDIANMLGVSKGAISGRVLRLGLSMPDGVKRGQTPLTPEERARRETERKRRYNQKKRAEWRAKTAAVHVVGRPLRPWPKAKATDITPLHVSLFDLGHDQCRFPYGDGPFTFCGCRTLDGSSYCEPHKALTTRVDDRTQHQCIAVAA